MPNLTERSLSAIKWNYFGNGVRALLQLVAGVVLARLLGPEAFGVVAIAWLMISFGGLFSDLGFSAAVVQRPELSDQDLAFTFTAQIFLGLVLTILGVLLAGPIAAFFRQPEAESVIRAMALVFVVRAGGQTSVALMNRALRFRETQAINIGAYLLGYALIGIPLAFAGWGVWSLVIAQLVQSAAATIAVLVILRAPLRVAARPAAPGLIRFGLSVVGANLTSWSISNIDSLVVGRAFGAASLGLYNRALTLVSVPLSLATTSLQPILFAACSRAEGDLARIRRAFVAAAAMLGYICLPFFLTVAVVPATALVGTYGERWAAASPLVTPIALAMLANALVALPGPVLTALGRPSRELGAQLGALAVMIPVLFVLSRYSIEAVAWGVLLVAAVRALLLTWQVGRLIELKATGLARALALPAAVAVVTAAPSWAVSQALAGVNSEVKLILVMATAGAFLFLSLRLLGPRILSGELGELLQGGARLPAPLRWWLRA